METDQLPRAYIAQACAYCGGVCLNDDPDVYREATIWIGGTKSNHSAQRVYTGRVACPKCVDAMKHAQPPGEGTLFDPAEPHIDAKHYNLGFDAGWRGDELIDPPSKGHSYLAGYEAGQTTRESIGGR